VKTLSDRIEAGMALLCRLILYITLGVTFLILSANVGLRYVMGSSLAWASELPELMFPWMIMAGVVLAAINGSHIAVVLVTDKLGASRRWVLAGGMLAVAVLYLGLCVAALPLLEISADEFTPIMQVPGSLTVGCLMGGFVMLAITSLLKIPRLLAERDPGVNIDETNLRPEVSA
jgi:TRAP-type C4-dicarboxylate transport system permease small subunit